MPVNKDALIRYRVINRRLKNKYKEYPTLRELIDACEEALGKPLSVRTIQADIQAMRYDSDLGYNAPISYDAKIGGYKYTDDKYSIDNIPLNQEDLDTLEFATKVLDQFKNVEILKPFTGVIEKIASSYKISRQIEETKQKDFIEFESAPLASGTEFINPILKSIKEQKEINLEYQSFKDDSAKTYELHPYLLKEYKNRWYLVAWNDSKSSINTFGLDRILNITEGDRYFQFYKGFDPNDFFKDAFGITAPQKLNVKKIHLKFNSDQGKYIKSQPLHHSQKIIKEDKKGLLIEINVMISYELKSQMLSYGSSVEVIKPKSLKNEISDEIKKMRKLYSS
jgi:predicted DNA-binding transcriptional regulator YafY